MKQSSTVSEFSLLLSGYCSKLEEVTSELSTLKEVMRSHSSPRNLPATSSDGSASQYSLTADANHSTRPMSSENTFFGIDSYGDGFFEIEPCLGNNRLSGNAIVELFKQ